MARRAPQRDILAAGAVVTRKGDQVLLVHRPRYNDWAFPKGKLDRGEHIIACAVREVLEETGLHIRLGPKLTSQRYALNKEQRMKTVHYWLGRVVGDDDVSGFAVNEEIDELAWFPWAQAERKLTYDYDRETLAQAWPFRKKSRSLLVLRHAAARSRKNWGQDDRERPLLSVGKMQAERLIPLLAAYNARRIATSSSTRCAETIAPYAELTGHLVTSHHGLSEEDATPEQVQAIVDELLGGKDNAVLCTHRPVLPEVFEALGLVKSRLEPSDFVVVHHRRGQILATEHVAVGGVRADANAFM